MVKINSRALQECRKLYEAMYRFDTRLAGALGLHISDVRCINALETGPLSPGELKQRLGLTSGSVSAMLDRLEAKQVITREQDTSDKRRWRIVLNDTFHDRAAKSYGRLGQALASHIADLQPSATKSAASVIAALARSFDDAEKALHDKA